MILDPHGQVGHLIELRDCAAKKRSGRVVPMHPDLRQALVTLRIWTLKQNRALDGPVVQSERSCATDGCVGLRPGSLVYWFARLYRTLNLTGCSSHSGRRTFVTSAARLVHRAGGSLRDVQQLAGHRSIEQTQAYIDGHSQAKRRLVRLI
jgi:integrase/recombinase XerD